MNVSEFSTLRNRFLNLWDAVPQWQTLSDNQPDNPDTDFSEPYVRFAIRGGEVERPTLGSNRYRAFGRVWLQIFVPRQSGATAAQALVDAFAVIFRDWQSEDGLVRCYQEEQRFVPNGEFYQVNVSIPYQAERFL